MACILGAFYAGRNSAARIFFYWCAEGSSVRKRIVEFRSLRKLTGFQNFFAIETFEVLRVVVLRYHTGALMLAGGVWHGRLGKCSRGL